MDGTTLGSGTRGDGARHAASRFIVEMRRLRIVGLVLTALLAVAGASRAQGVAAPEPDLGGTLVFASDADGDTDVYAVAARGGRAYALSRNHDDDVTASLGATVVRSWRGTVFVLRAEGRWRRVANGVLAGVYDQGRRVAVVQGATLLLATVSGRRPRHVPLLGEPYIAPDGRSVAFVIGGGRERLGVVLIEVATGMKRRLASGSNLSVSWSPEGSSLLITTVDDDTAQKEYRIADVRSSRPPRLFARGDLGSGSWSPDGRWIAFTRSVESGAIITVVDTRSGRRWVSRGGNYPSDLTWSGDSSRFAYRDSRADGYHVVVANARARISRTVARSTVVSAGPLWATDGRRIAYVDRSSDSEMSLAIVGADGSSARTLVRGEYVVLLGWNPDSKRLVFAIRQGIGVVGVDGRMRGVSRTSFRAVPSAVVWSPSGQAVAFSAGHNGRSVYVLRADGKRLIRLTRRGHDEILAWLASRPPRRARPAPALPPTERAAAHTLDTRGPIVAVSAHGAAAGVLVAAHELDCIHPVVWRPRGPIARIGTPAPCEDDRQPLDVELIADAVLWSEYTCGNDCYTTKYRAARASTDVVATVDESSSDDAPEPPLPPGETRRGVSIVVDGGVVRLRRLSDGVEHTVAATGARIFDAELEDEGLYYAFNRPRGEFRGRVVFVPFDELFPRAR